MAPKICRFFEKGKVDECRRGKDCPFAHTLAAFDEGAGPAIPFAHTLVAFDEGSGPAISWEPQEHAAQEWDGKEWVDPEWARWKRARDAARR